MKPVIGLMLFLSTVATGASETVACPWFRFQFKDGSAEISAEDRKGFETFLTTITDLSGKVRIYGPELEVEPGEKPQTFWNRSDKVRELVDAWAKEHPKWLVFRPERLPASDGIKRNRIEVEFHGYDDARRHEKTFQEETQAHKAQNDAKEQPKE